MWAVINAARTGKYSKKYNKRSSYKLLYQRKTWNVSVYEEKCKILPIISTIQKIFSFNEPNCSIFFINNTEWLICVLIHNECFKKYGKKRMSWIINLIFLWIWILAYRIVEEKKFVNPIVFFSNFIKNIIPVPERSFSVIWLHCQYIQKQKQKQKCWCCYRIKK